MFEISKEIGKSKKSKSVVQPIKDISSPVIFDSASVKGEIIPIKGRSKAKTNSRIPGKDRTYSLSTFSINSDVVPISSNSEIFSGRIAPTAQITKDQPKSKLSSGRRSSIQGKLKKVSIPKASKDFDALKKEPSHQIKSKPQQTQKKVEQTFTLDDRIKALRDRRNALQQELACLKNKSKGFLFIKSKEQKDKEKELNFQLEEVTRARWRVELDRKFEGDKDSKILDFVNESRDASNSNNKHLEEIDKIVQEHFQQYGHYICDNRNDFLNSKSFVYKSLQEILDRANPTYEDKQILLRYDAYQVKSLLQSGNIREKGDKRALKKIYKDLKSEMSKSRKNFDSKDDQYICKLRKSRSASPDSIIKSVQIVQQLRHSRS